MFFDEAIHDFRQIYHHVDVRQIKYMSIVVRCDFYHYLISILVLHTNDFSQAVNLICGFFKYHTNSYR